MFSKKNKGFYSFLYSYILLVCIPIIILGALFGTNFNTGYKKEILATLAGEVKKLELKMENNEARMRSASDQIKLLIPSAFSTFETNPLTSNTIKEILSSFVLSGTSYDTILLFKHNSDYIISDRTTYEKHFFYSNVFSSLSKEKHSLPYYLEEATYSSVISVRNHINNTDCIAFISPLSSKYATTEGALVYIISHERLLAEIDTYLGEFHPYVEIRNNNGTLLLRHGEKPKNGYFHKIVRASMVVNLEIPRDIPVLRRLNWIIFYFIVSLILTAICSFIAIHYFMKINYGPILRLHEKAKNLSKEAEGNREEFHLIDATLDNLSKMNKDFEQRIEVLQGTNRNTQLQKLLTGSYYSTKEEFNADGWEWKPLIYDAFQFACLLFNEVCPKIEEIAKELNENLNKEVLTYHIFTPIPRRLYLIFNLADGDENEVPRLIEKERMRIEQQYGLILTIGLSSLQKGITTIPKEFLESRTALDYRFVKGKSTTIFFSEVNQTADIKEYPSADLDRLRVALLSKNHEEVESVIDSLIKHILSSSLSLFEAKGLCFDILRIFIKASPSAQAKETMQKEMLSLSDIETAAEVIDIIKEWGKKQDYETYECPSHNDLVLIGKMKDYIEQNYCDCNFSMQGAAEALGISISYFSIFFKEQTGTNPVDYTSTLRMQKAKQLLKTTDLSAKEISLKVGYYNVSSFIRRFKQMNGITPGDYRKIRGNRF